MAFNVFAVSISRHCFHRSPTFPHSFGPACGRRQFTAGEPIGPDLLGQSAYDVLGVREGSSIAEIKASFRRLAKECHPDINPSAGSSASHRFLIVLATYEILSDSERRAQYDSYLISKRKVLRNQNPMHATGSELFVKEDMPDQGEVAEWLIWYRLAIKDILLEKRVPTGSGYFHDFENELYEAIRAAYYGPIIESMELLPDCFEAEERSVYETSEVLHLVSGRDLFGIVKLIGRVPQLSNTHPEKLTSSSSMHRGVCDSLKDGSLVRDSKHIEGAQNSRNRFTHFEGPNSDAYKDLELYVYGELVASATRTPSKVNCVENCEVEANDIIRIYLNRNYSGNTSEEYYPRQLVGTVEGLGSSPEEGSCFVYNGNSEKTHVIMKHRTLLVKHLHWYQIGDRVSTCECRCSRARLPSSKFWLFEPRCGLHDIGGWYIETFGRDKSGKTILCQRQWDSAVRIQDKRLHPAMYLLTLAYRTLDIEVTKRRKQTLTNIIRPRLNYVLQWCKKCV